MGVNIFSFSVPLGIGSTKLYPLVRRMLPELADHVVRDAFAKRDVKMDGVRCSRDTMAKAGAEVCLYTRYSEREPDKLILYKDANILVVRKPVGVSCEEDSKGGRTIAQRVGDALACEGDGDRVPLLCHRLDNQTDGLLLLARNLQTEQELRESFQQHQIHKEYECLVRGTPNPSHAVLHAYLYKDAAKGRVWVRNTSGLGALSIITEYEMLSPGEVARLKIVLHTGRTHQIRAQMAAVGHPLLGDDLYGDRAFTKKWKAKRLMLCATRLSFSITGRLSYLNAQIFRLDSPF